MIKKLSGLVTIFLILCGMSLGQAISVNGGSIQGTITDPTGAVVSHATVIIEDTGTHFTKTITTDSAGFYSIGPLNPGNYVVSVQAAGFESLKVSTVIRTGTATNGNFKLVVGQSSATVEVDAGSVQVNTEQAGVSNVLTTQQIESIPVNGHNFLGATILEPGVQVQDGNTFDPTKAGYSSVAINGVSGRTTRILLDGQDITDENVGTTILNLSQSSVSEVQLNRSTQDVSNELTSTGALQVATRSGTNQFHGQLFYAFQDHNAGFAKTKSGIDSPFQRNQFGGRLGGPILKDKLFFFGSSERTKQDSSISSPIITPGRFAAIAQRYPTIALPYKDTTSVARIDYNAPFGIHMFARAMYDVNASLSNGGDAYDVYANRDNVPGLAGGADFSTGNFTHSFRISYEKMTNLIGDASSGYNPIKGLLIRNSAEKLYAGPNDLAPQATYQSDKQFRYDGGWTKGRHNLRYGTGFNRLLGGGYASFFGLAPRFSFSDSSCPKSGTTCVPGFDNTNPLNYLATSVRFGNDQGYFSELPEFGLPEGGQRDWRFSAYVADSWKMTPRFTLSTGLRYARDTGRADQDLGVIPCSDIDPAVYPSAPCSGSTPLLDQFQPGLGKKVNQPNANFGPQVGLAYALPDQKTVLRSGFGIYYESNIWNNILFDRENRLKKGLFEDYSKVVCTGGVYSIPVPGGAITSLNGESIKTICGQPLGVSGPKFVQLQKSYQTAIAQAGPQGNPNYPGETLQIASAFYAPKYVSPYSIQYNFGIQRQLWSGIVLSIDYIHNSTLKLQQTIDANHVGAARYLNVNAAKAAIAATGSVASVLKAGGSIQDYANNGLDSGNNYLNGYPAANPANGLTPDTGAAFPGRNPAVGLGLFNFPSGRAGYDALEVNLREQKQSPLPGVLNSVFEVSYTYSHSGSTSGSNSGDGFFTTNPFNFDNATQFYGPSGLDRRHMLAFGGTFQFKYGLRTALSAQFYSAPPSSLFLDQEDGAPGDIFRTDIYGSGQTTAKLAPDLDPGAYMRSVGPKSLNNYITKFNSKWAGQLTPAGQALVAAGLFTQAQLVQLGAAIPAIQAVPTGTAIGNSDYKNLDTTFSYPVRLHWLGESASLEPAVTIYNIANFANFGNYGNQVSGILGDTTRTVPNLSSYINGPSNFTTRDVVRTQRGSGANDIGGPRTMEFALRLNF